MVGLLWIVRIYKWWLIAWVLLTWIPGVAGSAFHQALGIPILPVLNLFSFLHIGFLGLQAIIPLILLGIVETWLVKRIQETQGAGAGVPLPAQSSPIDVVGTEHDPPV